MKLSAILLMFVRLLVLWFVTVSTLVTWYFVYLAYIPEMAEAGYRPGREMPAITPWVMDVAFSWQSNHLFWTLAAIVTSLSIVVERFSRHKGCTKIANPLRPIPAVYGLALLLVTAAFLYVVFGSKPN